jgi:preprotein translocase subunit SecA
VWHDLATVSIDLEAQSLFPFMRAALAEGLIHPQYVGHSDFDAAAAAPPGERLREFREARAPIYDVSDAIGWWGGFQPPEPRRVVKVGRNDPCPCGSGKKYKKCCGA